MIIKQSAVRPYTERMNSISLITRPRRKERILKQAAGGTVVLLDLDTGRYHALDGVGGRIWTLCDGSRTVSEIAAVIGDEYDAPPETIERDLHELLTSLANENLVDENV